MTYHKVLTIINAECYTEKYQKHKHARSNLFATQTKSLIRKFYTVQYVKKINFKQLLAFNIDF